MHAGASRGQRKSVRDVAVPVFLGFVTTLNEYYAWTENQCRTETKKPD